MATATTANTALSDLGQMPISPDFQLQALRTIIGQGGAIAASPYVGYGGPRLANLTPDQLNAQQMTRGIAAGSVVDPVAMQGAINYGLSGFDPAQVNKYMSPYTTGVVDEIARQGNTLADGDALLQRFFGFVQFGAAFDGEHQLAQLATIFVLLALELVEFVSCVEGRQRTLANAPGNAAFLDRQFGEKERGIEGSSFVQSLDGATDGAGEFFLTEILFLAKADQQDAVAQCAGHVVQQQGRARLAIHVAAPEDVRDIAA
mgnify:CR=1 FL=1